MRKTASMKENKHFPLLLVLIAFGLACTPETPSTSAAKTIADLEDRRVASSPFLIDTLAPASKQAPTSTQAQSSSEDRVRAALAMGRIQSPTYEPTLAAAAKEDQDQLVRSAAIFALGQMGLAEGAQPSVDAISAVEQALGDSNVEIVALAAEAWGKLAPKKGHEQLLPLLQSSDTGIRSAAVTALFRLRFAPVWRQQEEDPPELPSDARQALVNALGDSAPAVRRAAAHAFSRYGDPLASAGLSRLLEEPDKWTRIFAARALAKGPQGAKGEETADQEVLMSLLAALGDQDPGVRSEVVRTLTALGEAGQLPTSVGQDPSFHVRTAYVGGLGTIDSETAIAALRGFLEDSSTTVRAATVTALVPRLGVSYLADLQAYLEGDDWVMRATATRSLQHLGIEALPLIDRALSDEDGRVQAAALEALKAVPETTGVFERVAALLSSKDLAVRGTAVDTLENIQHEEKLRSLQLAYDDSPGVEWTEIRESIVRALAATDGASEFLTRVSQLDPAPSVRTRAQTTLTALGYPVPEPNHSDEERLERDSGPTETFRHRSFSHNPRVILETSKGQMEIEVFAEEAPLHAASFIDLVSKGFYDGLIWHRVVPNFVIQGGDPEGNGWGGPGYSLRDEIHQYRFRRGAVGMPKAGKDTGGCQIFICHLPTPHLDGNYTIFGQVTAGLDVIDQIEVGDRIERAVLVETEN